MNKKILLVCFSFVLFLLFPIEVKAARGIDQCPYGINYGGGGEPDITLSREEHRRYLEEIEKSGVCWIRVWLLWSQVEGQPGRYSWQYYDDILNEAKRLNLRVLLTIHKTPEFYAVTPLNGEEARFCPPRDMASWKRFVQEVVRRYKNRVSSWQIENEVYGKSCFQSYPSKYPLMLQTASEIIKKEAPGEKVVAAGIAYNSRLKGYISSWLRKSKEYFDVVDLHLHRQSDEAAGETLEETKLLLLRNKINKPLWIGETSFDLKHYLRPVPYQEFSSRINFLLGKGAVRVFWFKHRDGLWGPGIVRNEEGNIEETPLFSRYFNLISGHGWWFCRRRQGCVIKGDANCDGKVDLFDYDLWFNIFVRGEKRNREKADFNCDGRVTIDDYQVWLENS